MQIKIFTTIKGRIIAIFILCLGFTGLLTAIYSWQVLNLKKKLVIMEQFHEFFENILEIKRHEKNFMFFKEERSLKEIYSYLERTQSQANRLSQNIIPIIGKDKFYKFEANLLQYRTHIENCLKKRGMPNIADIRTLGTLMVDFAQNLLKLKRDRINRTLKQILILPMAYMGGFALLVIFLFLTFSKNVLSRLSFIRKATEEVAKGNFTPIPNQGKFQDEVTELINAFNKMAAELDSRWEQLIESRKLASIGTFTSGIAHELNNPLNNISITAESLLDDLDRLSPGESKEMILDIINQANRASEVVKNLLDFSRTEAPSVTRLELKEVIEKTISLIKNQIMIVGVKLKCNAPDPSPPIRGNLHNLEQAFLNLFLNAIQAMPDGGTITIDVRETKDGYVAIDVTDTGVGIKPEALEKIFDPFYTTKAAGRGTGLGLSIVYGIIKKHGGYVEVKSEVNVGTTFTIYLPIYHGDKED